MLCPLDQNPLPVLVRKKGLESVSMRIWPAVRSLSSLRMVTYGEKEMLGTHLSQLRSELGSLTSVGAVLVKMWPGVKKQ